MLLAAALATVFVAGGALAQAPSGTPPVVSAASAPSATQDIRDIRGPRPIESSWLLPALAAALVVGVGAGCAAWAFGRRRKLRVKRPHEIALDRLESARSLMREGGSREFSIVVSGIVREYIENAFAIIATHLTTHEFLSELLESSHAAVARSRPLLVDFLESCDLAKFGGWNLTLPAMDVMYQSAGRFVRESAAAQTQQLDASNSLPPSSTPITTGDTYGSLPTT
jgi:hypothetical protein